MENKKHQNKKCVSNDDMLVSRFLKDIQSIKEDDGFTERVMERIPSRRIEWDSLLFMVCVVVIMIALMFTVGKDIIVHLQNFHGTSVDLGSFFAAKSIYIMLICLLMSGVAYYNLYEN